MKISQLMTALALSVATTAVVAAPINANKVTKNVNVAYQCSKGGKVNVRYGFNSAGVPVTATVKVAGANRVLRYNQRTSDNVDTQFQNAQGFKLDAASFELKNVRKASISTITSSKDVIAYKDCSPR